MVLPCGLVGTLSSVLWTIGLFDSNATAMAAANIDFLTERGTWPSPPVPFTPAVTPVPIDTSAISSGDYLAIVRFDGLDPMIAWATGGVTGHSALLVWETDAASGNRTLYVCESTDKNPFGPVYFPPPYGVIRHEYSVWIAFAQAAAFHVAVLPLDATHAAAFNETAYWTWFYTVQGMPYGYHTMLLSFLDTYAPFANFPMPINNALTTLVLNAMDLLLGNGTAGVTVYSLMTWPLNVRLNASCASFRCVISIVNANKAAGRALASFAEVSAVPEPDDRYYGANQSMVCSEFAARGWKAALAGTQPLWGQINAAEQTPKDNYQMAIYDTSGSRFTAATCPGGLTSVAGGVGAYCQVTGAWQLPLNAYNTIPLYAGMNNACPAQWPSYERCPAGNPQCC